MSWNICKGANFSNKSENFLICQLSRKSRNFIYPGLEMCEVSARMEKVENFPIGKNREIFFENLMNWNICSRGKFSDKSEIFSTFQTLSKIQKKIHLGL